MERLGVQMQLKAENINFKYRGDKYILKDSKGVYLKAKETNSNG